MSIVDIVNEDYKLMFGGVWREVKTESDGYWENEKGKKVWDEQQDSDNWKQIKFSKDVKKDRENKYIYYYNDTTKETSFDKPDELVIQENIIEARDSVTKYKKEKEKTISELKEQLSKSEKKVTRISMELESKLKNIDKEKNLLEMNYKRLQLEWESEINDLKDQLGKRNDSATTKNKELGDLKEKLHELQQEKDDIIKDHKNYLVSLKEPIQAIIETLKEQK